MDTNELSINENEPDIDDVVEAENDTALEEVDSVEVLEHKLKHARKELKQVIKTNKLLVILIIILLLMFGGGTAIMVQTLTVQTGLVVTLDVPMDPSDIPDGFDENTSSIDETIKNELNKKLEMNKMCIDMNSKITFDTSESKGYLNIKNNSVNNFAQFVTITLESNGAQIYQTGLIRVGDCIAYDTLDVKLPKGTHSCIATFTQVDTEKNKTCGQASAKIVITVNN